MFFFLNYSLVLMFLIEEQNFFSRQNRGENQRLVNFWGEASLYWPMTGIQNVRKWRQFVLLCCGQKNVNKIMPDFEQNKKLYWAFSWQANRLTMNIEFCRVFQGWIGRLKKMHKFDKLEIMNYNFKVSNKGNQKSNKWWKSVSMILINNVNIIYGLYYIYIYIYIYIVVNK